MAQLLSFGSPNQYSYKKRVDGGTDFYNGNQKTTIENYVKGTGTDQNQLRQTLANQGDVASQQILKAPVRPTLQTPILKTNPSPTYKGYNLTSLNPATQTQVKGIIDNAKDPVAVNRYLNSAKNAQTATQKASYENSVPGQILNTVGDVGRGLGGFAVDTGNFLTRIPQTFQTAKDNAQIQFDQLTGQNPQNDINRASLNQKAYGDVQQSLAKLTNTIAGQNISTNDATNQEAKDISSGKGTPSEFLNAGLSSLNAAGAIPVGKVIGLGAKELPKAVSLISDKVAEATPKVISATRTALADQRGSIGSGLIDRHPAIQQLNDHLNLLKQADEQLAKNGMSAKASSRVNNIKAQRAVLNEISNTRNKLSQGGYIQIPGKSSDAKLGQENRVTSGSGQQPPSPPSKLGALPEEQQSPEPLQQKSYKSYTDNNPNEYIKQQTKLQEQARKAGTNPLPVRVKNEVSSKLLDSFAPIESTLNKAIKNGADIKVSDANHITPQLDRALRADTIAGQYIKDNGLAKVIQTVPNTKAFDQYLIAKHAGDLAKNGIETGRDLGKDAQLVKQLSPTYEAHAQAIKKYSDGLLDKSVDYGLISKETADLLKKKYPNYVPANRIFGENELNTFKGTGGGKASISGQTVVQKIKGSQRQIESPLASLASKTQDVISQGERNKAASILASYKDLPGNPFALRELKPDETVGTKSTISFLDNGKVKRYETTPEIASAAKSLNKEQIGILGKIVRIPTRILRLGATGINPGFALANITKDLASALINTEHPFKASILNPKVLGKATASALDHGGKSYAELVREGAGGTSFDIARNAPRDTVASIRAGKNAGTHILYTVTHPGELLRAVENTIGRSEEFSRALQYYGNKEAGLANGLTESEATRYGAHSARNNTVNFARAGEYGAVLNSALPYLNAGIQGSRTLLRSVRTHPAQTLTKLAIVGAIPTATITAWNLSDPKRAEAYNDISEYEKQGNLVILPPNPVKDPQTGRWNAIKIPVSQEIANLNNIVRNSVEQASGQDGSLTAGKILGDLTGTVTSLNAQSQNQLIGQVVPQALKPAVETITNTNLFTGNKIVPDSQKNLPAQDQYGQYTSGTAKVVGKLTGTSPRVIDNGIKTAAGGAGQNAVNLSDNLLASTGVISPSEVQGKSVPDAVTNRFVGASSIPASNKADQAYQKVKDQLVNSPEYKALPQQDKQSALNRLQTDTNAITYNAQDQANPNNGYTAKTLTKNQKALLDGSKSVESYTTPTTKTKATTSQEKYQAHLTAYNQAKKDGTLSAPKDYATQQSLAKESVTSQYPQEVLDFYNLSKAQQNDYFASDKTTATKLYNQAKALDSQLVSKGLATTKYKTAITGSKSTKSSKISQASMNKYLKTAQVKAPKSVKFSSVKASSAKGSTLKKYTIAKIPKLTKVKKKAIA